MAANPSRDREHERAGGMRDRGGCLPSPRIGVRSRTQQTSGRARGDPAQPRPVHPPRSPDSPLARAESHSEEWRRAQPSDQAICPNLAYPAFRSPDAPLALLSARKKLQQEELSTRHHTPGEGLLMISIGRDGTRRIGVDCFIHIRNSRSLPRSQSPRAAGICSTPPIWELGLNLLLVALLQVNRVG